MKITYQFKSFGMDFTSMTASKVWFIRLITSALMPKKNLIIMTTQIKFQNVDMDSVSRPAKLGCFSRRILLDLMPNKQNL